MAITINVNLDEILAALKNDLDFTGNADKYIKVNATADGFEFAAVSVGSTWGSITGTLSDQTDLQSALDAKLTANSPITGATKTKVTYDANGLITSGADATTADIADSLDKRYITDAQQTILGNTSGTNTGDETTSTIKTKLGAASSLQDGYLTSTDWTTFNSKQAALGFTPEDVANKSTSTSLGVSDTLYPSQNAVKSYVDTGLATKYDASNPSGYITGIAWGAITGTLSSQTDLQSALDAKAALAGAAFTGDVSVTTSGSGDTLQLTNSGSGTTLNLLNSGSGDFLAIDSTKLVIDNGGDVSIGTATASARFHVLTGSTSKVGAIIQAAAGQTANLLEVKDSGSVNRYVIQSNGVPYTNIGSTLPQTNVAFGNTALNSLTSGQRNTAIGFKAGVDLTTGTRNTLIGEASGESVTTAQGNVLIGNDAGNSITTQNDNVIIGGGADGTGTQNTIVGKGSGGFSTGDFNCFYGETSGNSITNDRNSFYGWRSGRYIADGTTAATTIDDSVYLGASTKASANGISNEIVIGYNAIGNGSNSVTLGNTSITDTYLRGTTRMQASTASRSGLRILSGVDPTAPVAGDLWFDGTNLKFYDGTTTHNIV